MNKVVIICVLSLAMCLTQAAPSTDEHPAPIAAVGAQAVKPAEEKKLSDTATNATNIPPTPVKPAPAPAPKADTKPPQDNPKPVDPKTEEPKAKSNATTDNKTVPSVAPEPAKPTEKSTEKSAGGKTEATTTVTVKPTDAAKNETVKPTEAPKPKDVTEKPPHTGRGFDGSSFIGGIVLTLGLLAIGFMGLKYYKNKTERNYHTL